MIGSEGELLGALRMQSAPEQIADRIMAAIALGILADGDRLPSERELASSFSVSRTTVSQAIGRLNALGVVESRRGRYGGTFVTSGRGIAFEKEAVARTLGPLWKEMEAMLDYRNLVQQLIARTAAERRTDLDIEVIGEELDRYGRATTSSESRSADHRLHGAIANSTRNPYLVTLDKSLTSAANLGFPFDPYSSELRERALGQHIALVNAIVAGDPNAAAEIAGGHFTVTSTEPWRDAFYRST